MSNVVILGNGFDLNLGLKTSYESFLKSGIDELRSNEILDFFEFMKHNLNVLKIKVESIPFDKNINWSNIEHNLALCSRYPNANIEDLKKAYDNLKKFLNHYIELEHKKLNPQFYPNSAAYNFAREVCTNPKEDLLVLTFNYTKTAKIIFNEVGFNRKNLNVQHIHGEVGENGKNIVFGVNDSEDIKPEHKFLRKANYTDSSKLKYINYMENAKNIFFFGHSLGATDHSYFDSFFKHLSSQNRNSARKNLVFFYFDQDSLFEIKHELNILTQSNLTKLLQYHEVKFVPMEENKMYFIRDLISSND